MANHLLNAASSRSHALLSVVVRRKVGQVGQGAGQVGQGAEGSETTNASTTNVSTTNVSTNDRGVRVLKGKLLLVDLAGSERVGKSGAVRFFLFFFPTGNSTDVFYLFFTGGPDVRRGHRD